MYKINMKSYTDGYGYDEVNCNNHCVLAVAGTYRENYYKWIALLMACEFIWGENTTLDEENWIYFVNKVVENLGLYLQDTLILNQKEYLQYIISNIDSNIPSILFLSSAYIPWNYTHYKNKSEAIHGIIINGYDEKRKLFFIRDNAIIHLNSFENKSCFSGNTMWEFCLPYSIIFNVIKKSNKYLGSIHSFYNSRIFNLILKNDSIVNNNLELMDYIITKYNPLGYNRFVNYVNDPLLKRDNLYLADKITLIANRLDFFGNYKLIFRVLESLCRESRNISMINQLYELRERFINSKNVIYNIKTKSIITDKPLRNIKKNQLLREIYKDDLQLFNFIRFIKETEHYSS